MLNLDFQLFHGYFYKFGTQTNLIESFGTKITMIKSKRAKIFINKIL